MQNKRIEENFVSNIQSHNFRHHRILLQPHQKMDWFTPNSSNPPLLSLNNDCFNEIFTWLTFNELCSLGQTCKQLQHIAGMYFQRKYSSKQLTITKKFGEICIEPKEMQCFIEYTQNIDIADSELSTFEFIRSNCSENIQKIQLSGIYMLSEEHAQCIENILQNVDTVELYGCVFSAGLYDSLLKYCKNMKNLVIKRLFYEYQHIDNKHHWLKQQYSSLETFQWHIPEDNFPQFDTLLHHNSSIKCLYASNEAIFNTFANSNEKIDELTVKLKEDQFQSVKKVCNDLNTFYDEHCYNRLHLIVQDKKTLVNHIDEIALLNGLESLTFQYRNGMTMSFMDSIYSNPMASISLLTNLKVLNVPNMQEADILSSKLVYLQELHVQDSSFDAISPFIKNAVKLKKIFIKKINDHSNVPCLVALNRDREKLKDSCKMIIFIDENAFFTLRNRSVSLDFKFIEVKQIECVKQFFSPKFEFAL